MNLKKKIMFGRSQDVSCGRKERRTRRSWQSLFATALSKRLKFSQCLRFSVRNSNTGIPILQKLYKINRYGL